MHVRTEKSKVKINEEVYENTAKTITFIDTPFEYSCAQKSDWGRGHDHGKIIYLYLNYACSGLHFMSSF